MAAEAEVAATGAGTVVAEAVADSAAAGREVAPVEKNTNMKRTRSSFLLLQPFPSFENGTAASIPG